MIIKKIFLAIFASILVVFFTACENATFYDYSDVITNSKPTPENPVGTGAHSFTIGFETASNPLPANFQFQRLSYGYAGATDTTGDGFEVIFTLTLDVPDILTVPDGNDAFLEGSQNVKVTVDPYEKTEGIDNFPLMYFNGDNNLRTFTFTPTANTVQLTARYSKADDVQRGVLPLAFTYNEKVYKNTMPRKLQLSVFSNGTAYESRRVVLQALTEQKDDMAVVVAEPDNFVLSIKDTNVESTKNKDYTIPLVMNLSGVHSDYPISITAKDSENIVVSNIFIDGGIATFDVIHSGINKLQLAKGAVTLTVDSSHADKYSGLPFDVVINTERDETFKYFIDEYANNFTVSASTENLFDEIDVDGTTIKKYYTEVIVPSMDIAEARPEDMVIYEIFRKDDSSDFKLLHKTEPLFVNTGFEYKDYDAFILRNPEQEYKIKLAYSTYTNNFETATVKKGSRMLTDREVFIAAMDSMRYALKDKDVHSSTNTATSVGSTTTSVGTFAHGRNKTSGGGLFNKWSYYSHAYTLAKYNPYFIGLSGRFSYTGIQISILWDSSQTIQSQNPFSGTVNFTSPYGDGSITFNNIAITNDTKNNPGWGSGTLDVTVGDSAVSYSNDSANLAYVPFGFYMDDATFISAIVGAGYTQK